MIRAAQDYGSLNVHMRAKRMELFSAKDYNLFVNASDLTNLRQMLSQTIYEDIIGSEMLLATPNLFELDSRLGQHLVDQYLLYRKFIPKRAKCFVDAYSKKYFLNNVKVILSALHGENRFENSWGMLLSLTDVENQETEELYKSRNVEELISKLRNEDLRTCLENVMGEYRYLDLVYPLIIAVDQYFYSSLCKVLSKLKGDDKNKTISLFSAQVGIQNLKIIFRSKTFNVAPGIVKNWLIATKYCPLRPELRDLLIAARTYEETFNLVKMHAPFTDIANRLLTNLEEKRAPLENLDSYVDQHIVHKANSIFHGASFNIAIFPAFFILKEMEIRNLRTILLGIIHKRPISELLDKIVLV